MIQSTIFEQPHKSPYEEQASNRTPLVPQKVSDEDRLPTGTSQLVAFESELNKVMRKDDEDSQLNYLGIHHVKADEWKPTPDLAPCCVRCFSIVTFVLNYQLHTQELEKDKQAQKR